MIITPTIINAAIHTNNTASITSICSPIESARSW
nr:MAG TPA: hypothetical protein [Caudoviricetes sp.]